MAQRGRARRACAPLFYCIRFVAAKAGRLAVRHFRHILQLGVKELLSLFRDPVLLFLIAYSFTFSVYTPSKSAVMDVVNASVAVVDDDHSEVSRRIREALLPPLFLPPAELSFSDINRAMNEGKYTFIIAIPPKFQ